MLFFNLMRGYMISRRPAQLFFLILFQTLFMLAACGDKPEETAAKDKPQNENTSGHVDWGHEVNLNDMVAMAKKGQIKEIQWHVMPNILRAQTFDGQIFHLKNENKGVDLRNTLIDAGVKIGEGGVLFKHFF